jgi:heme O synthase-like polyprenyltransferase
MMVERLGMAVIYQPSRHSTAEAPMSPHRIIALSLLASGVVLGVLGLAFLLALGRPLVGWILLGVALADGAMAMFFARRGPA